MEEAVFETAMYNLYVEGVLYSDGHTRGPAYRAAMEVSKFIPLPVDVIGWDAEGNYLEHRVYVDGVADTRLTVHPNLLAEVQA